MKTQDLINELKYSTLKNIGIGYDNNDDREKQILSFINRAMRKIYADLHLSQKITQITKIDNQNYYDLPDDYIQWNSVYDEKGDELIVGLDTEDSMIYFTGEFEIYLSNHWNDREITIVYDRAPEYITDPQVVLKLRSQFIEAMILYITYISYEMINPAPQYSHQSFLTKYYQEIELLKNSGLIKDRYTFNEKLNLKGYR